VVATDNSQAPEIDLDRTDRLPILEGTLFDEDVEDDAVRMELAASVPNAKPEFSRPPGSEFSRPSGSEFSRPSGSEFSRPSGVDLPSLAESLRSVEERIARQSAEYEGLKRSYEQARVGEAAAVSRSHELGVDLAGLRATFEAEQSRSREIERALAEKVADAEGTRARIEETLRDAERYQGESHTLRGTLAARDATIVQVLHSLGERDAQLTALQREHARIVPVLEERSRTGAQIEADLRDARARSDEIAAELKNTRQSVAQLTAQLTAGEVELGSTRRELNAMKVQAGSYLENLRTREWRRGFDLNLFRELDAQIGVAQTGRGVLQEERDQLRRRVSEVEALLVARDESIAQLKVAATAGDALKVRHEQELAAMNGARAGLTEKMAALESERRRLSDVSTTQRESIAQLKAAAVAEEALRSQHQQDLQNLDGARADLTAQIAASQSDRTRLTGELAARDRAIEEALAAGMHETQRFKDSLAEAEKARVELSDQVQTLEAEAKTHEAELTVLMAHLHEARRPIQTIEADVRRLTDELAAKTLAFEALTEDNRNLRLTVERTRGALEEREFLIRRLERSESNNANVLGRIQTSIERLGIPSGPGTAGAPPSVECSGGLVRVDGQSNTVHALARRTRIGRAPGCELQIDSSSVSRHHALVIMGPRDVIIEDLQSTNGVLVNGRKISRQLLNDGDLVTIGEAQFRFTLSPAPGAALETPARASEPVAPRPSDPQ
jgi:chromosome segregation ATPase